MIVNELVSNSIKHGFPDHAQGEITVDFKREGDRYILNVSNNGVQFPEDLDIDNCSSLGLELVSALSKQLKGSITLNRKKITGFTLDFSC